jgi:pyruvate/2-oxoglutarate dehydrogenase complex dihydrolipoamide dehydrogenase (E3) component
LAVDRSTNGRKVGAEKAGIAVADSGFINIDRRCAPTWRTMCITRN